MLEALGSRRRVNAPSLFSWHLTRVLKSISRKVTATQRLRDPWAVYVKETINNSIFIALLQKFLKDPLPPCGFHIENTFFQSGKLKEVTLQFTRIGILVYFLQRFVNINVPNLFKKKLKCGSKAIVIATDDKPATITYTVNRHTLKMKVYYKVTNQYGYVLSF